MFGQNSPDLVFCMQECSWIVLSIALFFDLQSRRIPNWLTFPSLFLTLVIGVLASGSSGIYDASLGILFGFIIFFIPFALHWLGAGDVKLMMVLGGVWGAHDFWGLAFWICFACACMAFLVTLARGRFRAFFEETLFWILAFFTKTAQGAEARFDKVHQIPLTPAIALGTLIWFILAKT